MRKIAYWLIGALLVCVVFGAVFLLGNAGKIAWSAAENAVCEPTVADQAGVDTTSAFRLRFEGDVSANAVRQYLQVEPEIELGFHQGVRGTDVLLVPTEPLQPGSLYHFTLTTEQDEIHWTFQTKREWCAESGSPAHGSLHVAPTAAIEIYFNQSLDIDLAALPDYLSIEPALAGSFQQEGHMLRFLPEEPLQPATVYRVQLNAGLPAAASDQRLASGLSFSFETALADGSQAVYRWQASSLQDTYLSYEQPLFQAQFADRLAEDAPPRTITASLYRYADAAAYAADWLAFLESAPPWSEKSAFAQGADLSGLEALGTQTIAVTEAATGAYHWRWSGAILDGFYLLRAEYQGESRDIRFQITNLSAYVLAAEGQSLVWAHDLSSSLPLADCSITYFNSGQRYSTDEDGLAVFELNRELVSGSAEKAECYRQDVYLVQQGERALVVVDRGLAGQAAETADLELWQYICLDRDLYAAGDQVNFWGFMRRRDGQDWDWARVSVYLYADDAPDVPILHTYAPLQQDLFSGSIELPQLREGGYQLQIWQSGRLLIRAPLQIGQVQQAPAANKLPALGEEGTVLELDSAAYALGATYQATLRPQSATGSYLFYEAAEGLQEATVQDQPTYLGTFAEEDLGGLYLGGITFDGKAYHVATPVPLVADAAAYALDLQVTADQEQYQPGETATFHFSVHDAAGAALPQAGLLVMVGEAGGQPPEPLSWLYTEHRGAGLLGWQADAPQAGAQSSTAAAAPLYFGALELNAEGQAQLSLELPAGDWQLCAVAIQSGALPQARAVTLPHLMAEPGPQLTVQAAQQYQAGDAPDFLIRWQNLPAQWREAQIHYTLEWTGPAGADSHAAQGVGPLSVSLGSLEAGAYQLTVRARLAATEYLCQQDFTVYEPQFYVSAYESRSVSAGEGSEGLEGVLLFSSAERTRAFELLWQVFSVTDIGLEQRLATTYAAQVLARYHLDWALPAQQDFQPALAAFQKEDGGIGYQGRTESNLFLSMQTAALIRDGLTVFDRHALAAYFRALCAGQQATEARALALAGLASLGEPVLQEIKLLLPLCSQQPYSRACLIWGLVQADDVQVAKQAFVEFWTDYAADATSGTVYVEGGQGDNIRLNRMAAQTAAACGDFANALLLLEYLQHQQAEDLLTRVFVAGAALPRLYAAEAQLDLQLDGARQQLRCAGQQDGWLMLESPASISAPNLREGNGTLVFLSSRQSAARPAPQQAQGALLHREYQLYEGEHSLSWLEITIDYELPAALPTGAYALVDFPAAVAEPADLLVMQGGNWRRDAEMLLFAIPKSQGQAASGQIVYRLPASSYTGVFQSAPALLLDAQGTILGQSDESNIRLE